MYRQYNIIISLITLCIRAVHCYNETLDSAIKLQLDSQLIVISLLSILLFLSYITICIVTGVALRLYSEKKKLLQIKRKKETSIYVNTHAKDNQYQNEGTMQSNHIYESLHHTTLRSEDRITCYIPIFKSPVFYEVIDKSFRLTLPPAPPAVESIMEQDQVIDIEPPYTKFSEITAK